VSLSLINLHALFDDSGRALLIRCFSIIGQGDASEACMATLSAVEHPIADFASTLLEATSFAGTGNVLKIQTLLAKCGRHAEKPKKPEPASNDADTPPSPSAPGADGDVDMEGAATSTATGTGNASGSTETTTITPENLEAATAATGDGEDDDSEPEPLKYQSAAVIGIALVAMGEEVGR